MNSPSSKDESPKTVVIPIEENEIQLVFEMYQDALTDIRLYFDMKDRPNIDALFVNKVLFDLQEKLYLLGSFHDKEH